MTAHTPHEAVAIAIREHYPELGEIADGLADVAVTAIYGYALCREDQETKS